MTVYEPEYLDELNGLAARANTCGHGDVVCVLVLFRDGNTDRHIAKGLGWTFRERCVLFVNLFSEAIRAPFDRSMRDT